MMTRTWKSTENLRSFAKRDSLLALFAAVHVVALQFIRREERRQTVAQRDCGSHKQTESNTWHKRFIFAKPQEQIIFWRLTTRPQQLSYFQQKMHSSGCQLSSITHPAHWTNSPAHWTNSEGPADPHRPHPLRQNTLDPHPLRQNTLDPHRLSWGRIP